MKLARVSNSLPKLASNEQTAERILGYFYVKGSVLFMRNMEIYDPAMCCSTGVCGPGVNPELIRISIAVNNLNKKGFTVTRYNLANEPAAFVANPLVEQLLSDKGPDVMPIVIVDGQVVKERNYPSNEELCAWTGLSEDELIKKPKVRLEIKVQP